MTDGAPDTPEPEPLEPDAVENESLAKEALELGPISRTGEFSAYPPIADYGFLSDCEVTALVAAEKPTGSDRLILWVGSPVITTADETSGAKLVLANDASGDEEGAQKDDSGLVDVLAKEFKAQRWDADKSVWK